MTLRSDHQRINHAVALKAFDRIADAWHLSTEERCQILGVERSLYEDWKSGRSKPKLSNRQIVAVSKVLNIYDGLHRLFGDKSYADRWIRCENAAFDNQHPVTLLSRNTASFDLVFEYVMDALRI